MDFLGNLMVFLVMGIAVSMAFGWSKALKRLTVVFLFVFFTYACLLRL